jgi:hypothetical protein
MQKDRSRVGWRQLGMRPKRGPKMAKRRWNRAARSIVFFVRGSA